MRNFDVVTVGNAVIDLFLGIHDANASCRLNKQTNELCVRYGEKIELDRLDKCVGGNATNGAIGMARLGLQTGLIAEVGDDEFAQLIFNTLAKERVDTSLVVKTEGALSSMTVGINFQQERTLFVEHVKRKHEFVLDEIKTDWIYLTSLGNEWHNAYAKIVEFVSQKKIKLAFNPGTIQIEVGYAAIAEVLKRTDILFVNKEEGKKMLGIRNPIRQAQGGQELGIRELLLGLQKVGPKVVVITDGKQGSYAIDVNGSTFYLGLFPSPVVERTGAGDAYASGFLSAIIQGKNVPEAMRWGTANAAGVITKVGAQAGLLDSEKMEQALKEYKEVVSTAI